jgi:hypothetical protein
MCSGENKPMREKESRNRNLNVAFGTIFGNSFFKEASRNFKINLLFNKAAYKFKTIEACRESTD